MKYVNDRSLRNIRTEAFRNAVPFPWINFQNFLTSDGYDILRSNTPDLKLFRKDEAIERPYGQKPHDRFQMTYDPRLLVPDVWHEFVRELIETPPYFALIKRLFDTRYFELDLRWHYSSRGDSVSPHCDGESKLGTHLIYLNCSDDWDDAWGGQTLILGDGGRLQEQSAPEFDEFQSVVTTKMLDNYSLLFAKTSHSWHGVKELNCPAGAMRKLFSITLRRTAQCVISPSTANLRRLLGHNRKSCS
jgi:hypothetical protein